MGYGRNIDREVTVSIGNATSNILLTPNLSEITILLEITSPSRIVEFSNIMGLTLDDHNDPRTMGIGISDLTIRSISQKKERWDGTPIFVDLAKDEKIELQFEGFNELEKWGIWSKTPECCILLPYSILGVCEIQFFAQSTSRNNGQEICITFGDSKARFFVEEEPQQYIFQFNTNQETNLLTITGLTPESTPPDQRALGIGIHRLQVTIPSSSELAPVKQPQLSNRKTKFHKKPKPDTYVLERKDRVYSAIFAEWSVNKEWAEVVSAFVWNFQDDKNAVLIMKNSSTSAALFFSELMYLFHRIGEMKCRVIAIHSHDTHSDVNEIISASDVYLHTETSIPFESGLENAMSIGKISIVTTTNHEEKFKQATIHIEPNRQPKRRKGTDRGIEKDLEHVLDWDRLTKALQTAHGLRKGRSK